MKEVLAGKGLKIISFGVMQCQKLARICMKYSKVFDVLLQQLLKFN